MLSYHIKLNFANSSCFTYTLVNAIHTAPMRGMSGEKAGKETKLLLYV